MAKSKIVDETEMMRWFREGRTYRWMQEQYLTKYNIDTTLSMWANLRRRRGLDRRWSRDTKLIPWQIAPEHRQHYDLSILRFEARRRDGRPLTPIQEAKLESRLAQLAERDLVIHYDPETEQGFWYVPRRPGVDLDLIHEPSPNCGYLRKDAEEE